MGPLLRTSLVGLALIATVVAQTPAQGLSYVARIEENGFARCTGVLEDRETVLTMLDCIDEQYLAAYRVVFLGEDGNRVTRKIESTQKIMVKGDFEVIRLLLSDKIRPQVDMVGPVKNVFSTDRWGQYSDCKVVTFSGRQRNELVEIPVSQERENCPQRSLCLNVDEPSDVLCRIDSGAPILCKLDQKLSLAGMITVSSGCQRNSVNGAKAVYLPTEEFEADNVIIGCGAPSSIDNGRIVAQGTRPGDGAEVQCDPGYGSPNGPTVFCQRNGEWSEDAVCIPDCGMTPCDLRGNVVPRSYIGTLEGDVADVVCVPGDRSLTSELTCQADGQWETHDPCREECGIPTDVNGIVILNSENGTREGDVASLSCDAGYSPRPIGSITCSNGMWSNASCVIDCGNPPYMPNGILSYYDTTIGNIITTTCDVTYFARDRESVCQSDGTWSSRDDCYQLCPTDFRNYTMIGYGSGQAMVIKIGYEGMTQVESMSACAASGGELVMVDSNEKLYALVDVLSCVESPYYYNYIRTPDTNIATDTCHEISPDEYYLKTYGCSYNDGYICEITY